MAEKSFFLHALLVSITLSLYLPSIFSHYTTTVFDVSASLQRTLDVLSFEPQSLKPTEIQQLSTSSSPSPSFSLSLHPRSSIYKTHFDDYKPLTQSRLERDWARVKSIHLRLELAVNGVNSSELKPVGTTVFQPAEFEMPLTSGFSQGSGEYFARVGVGRPAKEYYVVTDTGSDVSWLQCNPCDDCYQQTDPIFDPSGSSSYKTLSCNSPQCSELQISGCQSGSCLYQVSYGDGSFTTGNLVTETLTFGSSGSVDNVAFGCGHDNEGLFTASAGLLGLGGGALSLPSQFKATSFSYCLVHRDSSASSTLEFNSATPSDSVTAPLLRNPRIRTYLYVDFVGFNVGGKPLELSPSVFAVDESGRGGVIVDSGTSVTRLTSQAYTALRDTFASQARSLGLTPSDPFALFDTCYDLSSMQRVAVPTLSFLFAGGKSLRLPPENYLIPVDNSGKVCFAFASSDRQLSIIGNIQQQGTRVSYNLANKLVGFSANKC